MATITNVSLVTVYVTDQTEAKQWYIDKLGFVESADVTMGDNGFRWVTVAQPDHPELEVTLMVPGPRSTTPSPRRSAAPWPTEPTARWA